MCLALRLRVSLAAALMPPTGLHFKDRQICHYFLFCCQVGKKPDPQDTVVLLKFYDFVHHWSKLLASKLTWWNLYFTLLRGPFTMNVKATVWKFIFKTYFCRASDGPRRRHHTWSNSWCCVPLPCTQLWTNQTQHREIFSISHHLTALLFRTWHRLLQMEA